MKASDKIKRSYKYTDTGGKHYDCHYAAVAGQIAIDFLEEWEYTEPNPLHTRVSFICLTNWIGQNTELTKKILAEFEN